MLLRHRLQEWAANRVTWVQYPGIDPFKRQTVFFRTAMPWEKRVGLVLFGVLALGACALVLAFIGLLLWALATA